MKIATQQSLPPRPSARTEPTKSDRLSALLTEAQSLPDRRRPAWAKYGPIVTTLRTKGMGYREIYDWLIQRGEPLAEKDFRRFRIASSTNQSRALKQAAKAAQKAKGGRP